MSKEKQYADRDIMHLDEVGNYYFRHVDAMTGEKLHSKSEIAAELGYRDMQIDAYRDLCEELLSFAKIKLNSMAESVLLMSEISGIKTTEKIIIERSTKESPIGKLNSLITKAEQLLGEKK